MYSTLTRLRAAMCQFWEAPAAACDRELGCSLWNQLEAGRGLSPARGSSVEAGDGVAGSVEAEPSPWKLSESWRRRGRLSGS